MGTIARLAVVGSLFAGVSAAEDWAGFSHRYVVLPDPFELAPGELTAPVSEQSLQWPFLLYDYFWYTGDEAFVRRMVVQHLPDWHDRFRKLTDGHGLLHPDGGWTDSTGWPSAVLLTNVVYYGALTTAAELEAYFGQSPVFTRRVADRVKVLLNARVMKSPELLTTEAAALFTVFGIDPAAFRVLAQGDELALGDIPNALLPFVAEAAFISGRDELAREVLDRIGVPSEPQERGCDVPGHDAAGALHWCNPAAPDAVYLLAQYVYGIRPAAPGWRRVQFAPLRTTSAVPIEIGIPGGRLSVDTQPGVGMSMTTPPRTPVKVLAPDGGGIVTKSRMSHEHVPMTESQRAILEGAGWRDRVGDEAGIWISAAEQMLRVVRDETILYQARCATAAKGLGSEMDSLKTPVGWHEIRGKIGGDAPWGQVFRARRPTKEVWQYGEDTTEDLVLTRVLLLDGLEPGKNKGGRVDSMARHIYIHGTNDEAKIGTPSSHGCIRMYNDEVIELFERVADGTKVLITAE